MTRALIAALALTTAIATGCGSSSGGDADKILYNAANQTSKATGAHIDVSIDAAGDSLTLNGFQDFAGKRGEFTMTLPQVGDIKLVFDDDVYYFLFPDEVRDGLGVDTDWVSASAEAAGGGVFGNSSGFDAAQLLDQLRTAGEVSEDGEETIDGAKTTKFHGTIDLRKVPDTLKDPEERAAAQKTLDDGLDEGLEPVVPIDVWVDEDSHIRRITEELEADGQDIDVTVNLRDFGTTGIIRVPEESTDISDKIDD